MPESTKRQIGKYQIQTELGRGGFGIVYRAYDPTVGRLVAIKVLSAAGDKQLLTRFRNEAASAGNLRHKNIVTIYDFGEHEGLPYIVMEFLEGEDLHQVIGKKPLPLLQKISIMLQVADGLYCAHRAGVIHRDVKPGNIRLLPDGTVKLMDFGIARLETGADGTRLTRQGHIIGTLLYMAPEQLMGGEADALCDVFAFGSTFYEFLTGKHPFQGSDPRTLFYRITSEEPEPIRSLLSECPEPLEKIVSRALHKDRELRYQSLREVQLDLEPIVIELRRERAESVLADATRFYESGQLERAQAVLSEVFDLDPAHREARHLREIIQDQLMRRLVQPKIEALLQKGERALAAREFQDAIESFDAALRLDRANSGISQRLEYARDRLNVSRQAAGLIADARREFARQNLAAALDILPDVLDRDPGNPEAQRLWEDVRGALMRQERERDQQEKFKQSKDLLQAGQFDEAAALVEQLDPEFRDWEDVKNLAIQIRSKKEQHERHEELKRELAAVREFLAAAQFESAIKRLETVMNRFPGEVEPTRLFIQSHKELAAYRKGQALDKLDQDLHRLSDAHDFERALELIRDALRTYPAEARLIDAQARIEAEGTEFQRRAAIHRVVENARNHIAGNSLEGGIEILRSALAQYPAEPELEELLATARDALAANQREEEIRRFLQQARTEAESHEYDRALDTLNAGLSRYAGDPRLDSLRDTLLASRAAWQRAEAIHRLIKDARAQIAGQNPDGAIELLASALKQYPDEPQLMEAMAAAQANRASRRRDEAVEQVSRRARSQAERLEFDPAIQLIDDALAEFGEDPRLTAARNEVHGARTTWNRSQAVQAFVQESRHRLDQNDPEGAFAVLEPGLREYPGDPSLAEAVDAAREALDARNREQTIVRLCSDIDSRLASDEFDDTLAALDRALADCGSDPRLAAARERVVAAKSAWERKETVGQALENSRRFLSERDPESAMESLEIASRKYADDPELLDRISTVRAALAAKRSEQGIQAGCRRAQTQIDSHDFRGASETLARILKEYGEDQRISELRHVFNAAEAAWQRAEAVRRLVQEAQQLIAKKDFQPAIALLESGLQQYAGETELASALATAREGMAALNRDRAIEEVCRNAESPLAEDQYDAVLAAIEHAFVQYGRDPRLVEFQGRVIAAKTAWHQAEQVRHAIEQSQSSIEASEFTAAVEILESALKRYPAQPQLTEGLAAARRALAIKRRAEAVDELCRAIAGQKEQGEYSRALKAVERGLAEYGPDPRLIALRDQLAAEKIAWERQNAIQRLIQDSEKHLQRGNPAAAIDALQAALKRYPSDPQLSESLSAARAAVAAKKRDEAIEVLCRRARAELGKREYQRIIEGAERALQEYPGDQRLEALRAEALSAKAEWERAQALRRILEESRARTAKGEPETAVRLLESALHQYPDNREIEKELAAAREAGAAKTRKQAVEALCREAQTRLDARDFERAQEIINQALNTYGAEPEIRALRDKAGSAATAWQRQKAVRDVLEESRRLKEEKNLDRAVELLDRALTDYPGDPDLLQAASELRRALEFAQREASIEELCREARLCIESQNFATARAMVEQGIKVYGSDRRLIELRQIMAPAEAHSVRSQPESGVVPLETAQSLSNANSISAEASEIAPVVQERVQSARRQPRAPLLTGKMIGIAAGLAVVAAGIGYWLLHTPNLAALRVQASPAGATVFVNDQKCTTPDCRFQLPPGEYSIRVSADGYESKTESARVQRGTGSPLLITLRPLNPTVQVTANLPNGDVTLDDGKAAPLQDGQFLSDGLKPGLHTLRISGQDGSASVSFETDYAKMPSLKRVANQGTNALALGSFGNQALLSCSGCSGTVTVDERAMGGLKNGALTINALSPGAHRLKITGSTDAGMVFTSDGTPRLQLAVTSNRNLGTLVVETDQDNATVLVDNRTYPRLTSNGQLRIQAEAKEHVIRVEKDGFRSEPPQIRAVLAKGDQFEARFKLVAEPARLLISGQVPGATVRIDGRMAGTVSATGAFSSPVSAGEHRIAFDKQGYTTAEIRRNFEAGRPLAITRADAPMTPAVQAKSPPPQPSSPPINPNAPEQADWQRVAQDGTPAELTEFLRKYPAGIHTSEAQARLNELRQQQANAAREAAWNSLDKGNKAAVQEFLSRYADGTHAQDARALLASLEKQESDQVAAAQRAKEQAQRAAADSQAVALSLSQFEAAYNRKDLEAIQSVWTDMPKNIAESYRNQFRQAKSLAFRLTLSSPPVVNGDAATAICSRSLNFTPKAGERPPESKDRVQVTLSRSGARWVIRSIAAF